MDSEGEDQLEGLEMDIDGHTFGWDNESPPRQYEVKAFRADWRPVTNGEYEAFWRASGCPKNGVPASWVEEDGEVKVCILLLSFLKSWLLIGFVNRFGRFMDLCP
jgi:formylglycine-generating enzyme required for sulfatase activity